jgi:hypothetical protein
VKISAVSWCRIAGGDWRRDLEANRPLAEEESAQETALLFGSATLTCPGGLFYTERVAYRCPGHDS